MEKFCNVASDLQGFPLKIFCYTVVALLGACCILKKNTALFCVNESKSYVN